jgi:uncharacterized membrane protein YqiK
MILQLATPAVLIAVVAIVLYLSRVLVYIPNDRVGVVERLWGGKSLTKGLIATQGEVGYQPQVLRGGLHVFPPFQYRVHKVDLVTIPQGEMGYVFARDGLSLRSDQVLGKMVPGVEDVMDFFAQGGQKGPQSYVLRAGTYAINLAQFAIITAARVHGLLLSDDENSTVENMNKLIADRAGFLPVVIGRVDGSKDPRPAAEAAVDSSNDLLGIVTVHDGPVLPQDEIVAPRVGEDKNNPATFHNSFQNIEAFFNAGGSRGRQHQVLVEGTYYLNRLFATVELIKKTVVPVGSVGVVVSYIGAKGEDRSGATYSHGELVDTGCRGVWADPLSPGKYAFNIYAGQVQMVPTTNFILKWSNTETSSHKFDANLSEVDLITQDAFEPQLPLSVVVHIDPRKAPMVVQRFGDITRLVEQTLDPMVSAYFKNTGQTKTLIELLQERAAIQEQASADMRSRFMDYNLELQEVLIGTPKGATDEGGQLTPSGSRIDTILNQLRDRQVAKEQIATFKLQEDSASQERSLREARATTEIQSDLTKSKINVAIKQNNGAADVAAAERAADVVKIEANATRARLEAEGAGEASRIEQIGKAEASAIENKVKALEGPGAMLQLANSLGPMFADAIKEGKIALVPQVQVGGGSAGGNELSQLIQSAVAMLATHLQPKAPAHADAVTVTPEKDTSSPAT